MCLEPGPYITAMLLYLFHGFGMYEVFITPARGVAITFPLLVHIEQGQMVTFGNLKLLSCRIRVLLPTLGAVEYGWYGQH